MLFDGRVMDVGIQKVTFPCKFERRGAKREGNRNGEKENERKRGEKSEAEANGEVSPFRRLGTTNSPTLEKNLADWFPVARFRTIVPRSNLANVPSAPASGKLEKKLG